MRIFVASKLHAVSSLRDRLRVETSFMSFDAESPIPWLSEYFPDTISDGANAFYYIMLMMVDGPSAIRHQPSST
jgi:hypothetical protein